MNWKSDKRIHFAVGVVLIFLGINWLFSGSLFCAIAETADPTMDDQGQRLSSPIATWLPIIFDFLVGICIGVGAYFVQAVSWIFSGASRSEEVTVPSASPVAANPQLELARAAATNDREALLYQAGRVRAVYAREELSAAMANGDYKAAQQLFAELKQIEKTENDRIAKSLTEKLKELGATGQTE